MDYQRKTDIICKICGYTCGGTYMKCHIKKEHNLSKEEYLKMFPDAILYKKEFIENMQKQGRIEMNKRWSNDKYRAKMVKVLQDNANNEDFKLRRIEAIKKTNMSHSEESKNKISTKAKERWADKSTREKLLNSLRTTPKRFKSAETKQKISNAISNCWENGIYNQHTNNSFGRRYNYINKYNDLIHLASLQELRVAYYLDLCNITYVYGSGEIKKFKYVDKNNKTHTYIPDFQVKEWFIEVKPDGWQSNKEVYNKLQLVQHQNNILLVIYDDTVIEDYMPKMDRYDFYIKCESIKSNNIIRYIDLFREVGDIRNELSNII